MKKVFLSIGHEETEALVCSIEGIEVIDSESNLDILADLMEFAEMDYLILNRLLDTDGMKLLKVAKKASESGIRVIMLVESFEGFEEKKLVASLVNSGVYSYLAINGLDRDKLLAEMEHYPETFDFSLLKTETDNAEQEEKIPEKVVQVGFTKKILTVWDNPEFGCELAYVAAKRTGLKILVMDADLLAPKADSILNVERTPRSIAGEGLFTGTGLNIVLDTINRNAYRTEILFAACAGRNEVKNLHVLTGNYELHNYEYYTKESYLELLDKTYQNFDLTIVLVNKFMYDLFTILSLLRSDCNIIPLEANLLNMREYNSYFEFLESTQNISPGKNKYVAFEYRSGLNLDKNVIKSLVGNNFLGYVSYDSKRVKYRNLRPPYARRMPEGIMNEYLDILNFFDMARKPRLKDRMGGCLSRYKMLARTLKKKIKRKNTRKKAGN